MRENGQDKQRRDRKGAVFRKPHRTVSYERGSDRSFSHTLLGLVLTTENEDFQRRSARLGRDPSIVYLTRRVLV